MTFHWNVANPNFDTLGYITAVANIKDKHDKSAPSDYHWKILKCRIIIFSNSSILASPDKKNLKQIHIIFNKTGDDYDKINSLFLKFSLIQDGSIKKTTADIFEMCFVYTMTAKIAPLWNTIGTNYLINNRDFLTTKGPQDGLQYHIASNESSTYIEVKPVKIVIIMELEGDFAPGEYVRVLPSLNKAIVEEHHNSFPEMCAFKFYKDLRRHWKNIHGYRLPEQDCSSYYVIRFWRGEPLTYPSICVTRNLPVIIPMRKYVEETVIFKFIRDLRSKMSGILGMPLIIQENRNYAPSTSRQENNESLVETQEVSLCTPTQACPWSTYNKY
ncbi:uncharacterized protein C18orf63-like [Achroia grisella]|uniref:uncharacterized protein C18orf63-like n=1 Tax=Achroia grisella TaxID=688607 RepID=UPI0027D2EF04|nr:uncharacterized protein C18orf63-like [Achroia grisella]